MGIGRERVCTDTDGREEESRAFLNRARFSGDGAGSNKDAIAGNSGRGLLDLLVRSQLYVCYIPVLVMFLFLP